LPHDEVMVARDAGVEARGFAVAARGGHNGAPHGHNDIGSVIVSVDGEPLIVDPGIGTYTDQTFGPDRFQLWTTRSSRHNVPLVGGVEQKEGGDFAARDVRCEDAPDRAVLTLDLAGGYPPEAAIFRWRRTVTLERARAVVISDEWTLGEPRRVELVWMLRDEPTVDADQHALRIGSVLIEFEPSPASLIIEPVALDDPKLTADWDRERLWRAVAGYGDAAEGTARATVRRA
jgi:hypothetical protein